MRLGLALLAGATVFAQLGHAHDTGLSERAVRQRRHDELVAAGQTLRLERRASTTTKASTATKVSSTTKGTSSSRAMPSSKTSSSSKSSAASSKTSSSSKSSSVTKASSTSKASTTMTKASSTSRTSGSSSATKAPSSLSTTAPRSTSSGSTSGSTTASPTTTTCAPLYTASRMIKGTWTLPKPSTFVKKTPNSNKLTLDGSPFTIVGPNIFWLCQGQDYGSIGNYTDKAMVREALAMAVALGANTIRALSCGISTGTAGGTNPYNLEPTRGTFNKAAWDIRDYVLYAAKQYGLRVILTLTDNYAYYHGGKYDFLNWRNVSTANKGAAFYTNKAIIDDFETYITKFLTRVNSYTGVAYKDDPTIIAWETGNELGGYINAEAWPPASWTTAIIAWIRKYDTKHLIIDGTNGFWNYTTGAASPGLNISGVDIVSDHGYPRNTGIITKELALAKAARENFLIGEYDWTPQSSTSLATYLNLIESWKPLVGDMFWNLQGRDPQCCNFIKHGDGYSMYYPNGGTTAETVNMLLVAQHWYRMTNRTPPTQLVGVTCPQPVF